MRVDKRRAGGGTLFASAPALPPQAGALAVLRRKYLAAGERGVDDVLRRVAHAVSAAERSQGEHAPALWARRFLRAMQAGFLPAGRILAAAGRDDGRCWMNCFVQPLGGPWGEAGTGHVEPTGGQGRGPDLERALKQTEATLRMGGGVGLDLSARADVLPTLQALDDVCRRSSSGLHRRGALMAVLRADHPQWAAFTRAKERGGLEHLNLSLAVDDAFMEGVVRGDSDVLPRWEALVRAAWATGEPGLLFLDTLQRDNSLSWRERLSATNPCGEQPLPPWGSCCLGSLDLTRFVAAPLSAGARFDHAALARVAAVAVRLLDNVITLTPWPLPEQRAQALSTRRIGLGFTGLADALALLGLRYDAPEGRALAARIASGLRNAAVKASVALASERGPFPAFDAKHHLAPPTHASRLPGALRSAIARHGLRNSHLLCVAPAGSISIAMADNVSSGIEPVWAWQLQRPFRDEAGQPGTLALDNHAWRLWRHLRGPQAPLPAAFVTVEQVAPEAQVAMVAAVAPFIDGAVSKTVWLPPQTGPQRVSAVFLQAWRSGLKGLTVYRPNTVIPPLLACTAGAEAPPC